MSEKVKQTALGKLWRLMLVKLPLAFFAVTFLWVLILKWCPVYVTPLMVKRSIEYRHDKTFQTRKTWVSYDRISPEMSKAVIASEDNLFDKHNGFDWKAIRQAQKEYESGKRRRGGSTISQQTAKNVFLLPHKSIIRKGFEAYFTVLIELVWDKRRIMEVYLNVAEMGKGIYGVEAAAETYFGTSATKLTRRQACLIAACLPNPIKRNPGQPSAYIRKRAGDISALEPKIAYPVWISCE